MIFSKSFEGTRIKSTLRLVLFIFISITLISNLSSNYINSLFYQSLLSQNIRKLLVSELNIFYDYCETQFQVIKFTKRRGAAFFSIKKRAKYEIGNQDMIILGLKKNAKVLFQASQNNSNHKFQDKELVSTLNQNLSKGLKYGFITLNYNGKNYFSAYRYSQLAKAFIIRGKEVNALYSIDKFSQSLLFIIILGIITVNIFIGSILLSISLRYLNRITNKIIEMLKNKEFDSIDLQKASNNDIAFVGTALNTLLHTTSLLINFFQKINKPPESGYAHKELSMLSVNLSIYNYLTKDLNSTLKEKLSMALQKLHTKLFLEKNHSLSINGASLFLTFENTSFDKDQDAVEEIAKNITYEAEKVESKTEVDKASNNSYQFLEQEPKEKPIYLNKSEKAIHCAYDIHNYMLSFQEEVKKDYEGTLQQNKSLSIEDDFFLQKIKKSFLQGVGIGGGLTLNGRDVIIGERADMTKVITKLTSIYKVPVICLEYNKNDVQNNLMQYDFYFLELDKIIFANDNKWQRVYWPILKKEIDESKKYQIKLFIEALEWYYSASWEKANSIFKKLKIGPASEFAKRTASSKPPKNWNGAWNFSHI